MSYFGLTPLQLQPVPRDAAYYPVGSGLTWTLPPGKQYFPNGITPPPPAGVEAQELAFARQFNQQTLADPYAAQFTEFLNSKGGLDIWKKFMKDYRSRVGLLQGWTATALFYGAMGVQALESQATKNHYRRERPFQVDPSITPIGKVPKDPSYPSGHSSAAYTAATFLSALWPARAGEYNWWARQVALSRIAGGDHFPSDVVAGATLGRRVGATFAELVT
jgi:membrane-associated phospholipid phosphatase